MGYPSSWHVVRIVPHPASSDPKSCMDLIYAGDPLNNVDLYYNHNAAFAAALVYEEGVSSGYEAKGGQMLPRKAGFVKGEEVEVMFDGVWYEASIVKFKMYADDIRYTVHYTEEDTTQNNVLEENIRKRVAVAKSSKKRKTEHKLKPKIAKKETLPQPQPSPAPAPAPVVNEEDDEEAALALAQKMGLPSGWTSRPRPNHRYYIKSADGKHRFRSRKQALQFLERNPPPEPSPPPKDNSSSSENENESDVMSSASSSSLDSHKSSNTACTSTITPCHSDEIAQQWGLPKGWIVRARSNHRYTIRAPDGSKYYSKRKALESAGIPCSPPSSKKTKTHDTSAFRHAKEEEGDPPWRREGHVLLDRLVTYNTGDDVQKGKVTGWLDKTDVDSSGDPAFLSERTGTPARLFHINFFAGDVVFVDLEEYELLECLIPEEGSLSEGSEEEE
eukprot:CAMPEP_0172500748 /NCGR_PEP_ID=MMETSP1066-20121228/142582_1 /TAXON_ID=671091 /ORGANISM="Coscinodiscus wailesii, Strain CCMP2513" /LENGTH=444 /DNA_ID=CAMNT_0013275157 /DNA_START=385 /DNA_END=1722 /DNA_ORIENTATION=+